MSGIIDGRRWLEERLKNLQAELDDEPPEDQRRLIESEMATLQSETVGGRRRFGRWLLWGGRPPTS